jgi:hypothetical protein
VARRDDRVGGTAELARRVFIAAHEHHQRQRVEVLGVAVLVAPPAGDQVVVALELRDVLGRLDRAVRLDEQVGVEQVAP